jgi:CMP-N-acetylneuraminic acid synthetase
MKVVDRPPELAQDETSIKPVLKHAIEHQRLYPSDDVVLLYPTYPGRSYNDITDVLHWYQQQEARTCLCCQPPKQDTPVHLAVDVDEDTHRGEHPFCDAPVPYRRQDVDRTLSDVNQPEDARIRELSHFVAVFRASELQNLSENLFNRHTLYYELGERVVDVDYEEDYQRYLEEQEE